MWNLYTQEFHPRSDVKALPYHIKDKHHYPGLETRNINQIVSRPAYRDLGFIKHIIYKSNTKLHWLRVSISKDTSECQAPCGIIL